MRWVCGKNANIWPAVASMKQPRRTHGLGLGSGGRAGMVCHHAPAARGQLKNIGRHNPCFAGVSVKHHHDPLHDTVHRQSRRGQTADLPGLQVKPALCQQGRERVADGGYAHLPPASRMDTDHLVLIGPTRHQRIEVPALQGVVESSFDSGRTLGLNRSAHVAFDHGGGQCQMEWMPRSVARCAWPLASERPGTPI